VSELPQILDLLPHVKSLWDKTMGHPEIRVAILDGPVDTSHPCFDGIRVERLPTLVQDEAACGPMSSHGTHVASVIFGNHDGTIAGIAPHCTAIIAPVFRDFREGRLSQLDLARAIEQAVQAGAHVVNISGGQRAPTGHADDALSRAIKLCEQRNILVCAAAGNDGCECLHVPAALPAVCAVGALGRDGRPLQISNWGAVYCENGILAPGENIVGAVPGGGVAAFTGSSFATPIVAGVAALLLSLQRAAGQELDPRGVRAAILDGARKCGTGNDCDRYLAGILDIPRACVRLITRRTRGNTAMSETELLESAPSLSQGERAAPIDAVRVDASAFAASAAEAHPARGVAAASAQQSSAGIVPAAADCGCAGAAPNNGGGTRSNIYAIGAIGFDFGTEARRDSFRQLMPRVDPTTGKPPEAIGATSVPPNPYDANQLVAYLEQTPWESTKLIWTLNLELTPIYAIEAEPAYADEVYRLLRTALAGEFLPDSDPNYVSRVSISGILSGRTIRLFSGQVVPVVVAQPRGLYTWNELALIGAVTEALTAQTPADQRSQYTNAARTSLRNFLDKVYYQLRNLGQTSPDRALNYAATNTFQVAQGILKAIYPQSTGLVVPVHDSPGIYTLDTITVAKSPFCRMDSDCWDVKIGFFDPENDRRARMVLQYTIDVSDEMPVSLGPTRFFAIAG
jgi:cyanobactin maturation PatA/PatG family protease